MIKRQCVFCGGEIVSANTIRINYMLQRTDICHNFVLVAQNEIQRAPVSEIIGQMTDRLGYVQLCGQRLQETQRIIAEPCKRSNIVEKASLSGGYVIDFLLCQSELEKRKIYWKLQQERRKKNLTMQTSVVGAERVQEMNRERPLSCFWRTDGLRPYFIGKCRTANGQHFIRQFAPFYRERLVQQRFCYSNLPSVGVHIHSTAVNTTSYFTLLQVIIQITSLYCS